MTYFKTPKIKSKKIRDFARDKHCTMRLPGICTGDRSTTSLCHVNTFRKGIGNKSHDLHSYIGCYKCHAQETAGRVSAEDILRAMVETQDLMIAEGLIRV